MSDDWCVALPRGAMVCLQFVIVVFPDHTHLPFLGHSLVKAKGDRGKIIHFFLKYFYPAFISL